MSKIDTAVVTVTPEMAQQWLEGNMYQGQRGIRKNTQARYANLMTKGQWDPSSVIKFAQVNGAGPLVLIDGNHRMGAVVDSGTAQTFVVVTESVPDWETIANRYSNIDHGLTRTDIDGMRAAGLPAEIGVNQKFLRYSAAAVKYMMMDFMTKGPLRGLITQLELHAKVREYAPAIKALHDNTEQSIALLAVVNKRTVASLTRQAVMSIAIATFHWSAQVYGHDTVADFWNGIILDDGLRIGDPRKVVKDHLANTIVSSAGIGVVSAKVVGEMYQSRYVANCWNAWAEHREIKSTRVSDASAPIQILGTPWKGK